jgi:Histidine kinase-like ATPase domain
MVAAPGPVPVSARSELGAASYRPEPRGPMSQPEPRGPLSQPEPRGHMSRPEPAAWPFSSYLELGALDSAVPCARLHARQVVREWGRPDLADTAELLVSELMTNAIRASAGLMSPAVALWLLSDGRCVVVQVGDGSHELPVRQDADTDSASGWGLLLVESLSRDWGSYRRANGKVVWARI